MDFCFDVQAFYGLKPDSGGDLNDKDHQGRYLDSVFPLDNCCVNAAKEVVEHKDSGHS